MIVNRRHLLTWGLGTFLLGAFAIGLRIGCEPAENESLSGGSWVGLSYGIGGGLLVLFALSLTFLRFVPSWWFLGSRALWLKGHIWLGLLSFVLILCHSGLRFGGPFEQLLYLVFFLVVVTGVVGLILHQILPRWMTLEVPCEVPLEQMGKVCATLRSKADQEMDRKCVCPVPTTCARIEKWYNDVMRPFLAWPFERANLLTDAGKTAQMFAEMRGLAGVNQASSTLPDLLARLEEYCQERRRLAREESLHRLLHGWLYLHVPLAWAMTVMMVAHAVMAGLYYYQ